MMNVTNAKNSRIAVNFESSAPASANANQYTFALAGSRHSSAIRHSPTNENRTTAVSVITSGPVARNMGVVTNAARQSNAAQSPPSLRAYTKITHPSTSV